MNKKCLKIKKRKIVPRRTWTRNPVVQIVPNQKRKEQKKISVNKIIGLTVSSNDTEKFTELYE